jgi:hypothetical protein
VVEGWWCYDEVIGVVMVRVEVSKRFSDVVVE